MREEMSLDTSPPKMDNETSELFQRTREIITTIRSILYRPGSNGESLSMSQMGVLLIEVSSGFLATGIFALILSSQLDKEDCSKLSSLVEKSAESAQGAFLAPICRPPTKEFQDDISRLLAGAVENCIRNALLVAPPVRVVSSHVTKI